jgi:hypothetical protein
MRRADRRTFCADLSTTVAGLGLVLGADSVSAGDDTAPTDDHDTADIEPNDVVETAAGALVRSPTDPDAVIFEAREGRPARARWPTTIDGDRHWRVSFGRKRHGWVRATALSRREPAFTVGDDVTITNETRVWPSVPAYFGGDKEELHDVGVGRTGTVTRSQFMNWGTIWWRVEWGEGVAGWTPERVLAPAGTPRAFTEGELVMAAVELPVRRAPTLDSGPAGESVIGTAAQTARGTIVDGYESAAGANWWKIDWIDALRDGPPTGWSREQHLQTVSGVPGSP